MIETGLFGGSFNPIHNGHVKLAEDLLRLAGLDDVWFMVSPQNPLKQQAALLDDGKRLELARAALADKPGLSACDYEFHLPRPSYTWDTLQQMGCDFPDRRFTLLIGADNWLLFNRWYRHDDILRNYRIMIYPRRGSHVDTGSLPGNVQLADTQLVDISSTEIRQRISRGEPISGLVPEVTKKATIKYYSQNQRS